MPAAPGTRGQPKADSANSHGGGSGRVRLNPGSVCLRPVPLAITLQKFRTEIQTNFYPARATSNAHQLLDNNSNSQRLSGRGLQDGSSPKSLLSPDISSRIGNRLTRLSYRQFHPSSPGILSCSGTKSAFLGVRSRVLAVVKPRMTTGLTFTKHLQQASSPGPSH